MNLKEGVSIKWIKVGPHIEKYRIMKKYFEIPGEKFGKDFGQSYKYQ